MRWVTRGKPQLGNVGRLSPPTTKRNSVSDSIAGSTRRVIGRIARSVVGGGIARNLAEARGRPGRLGEPVLAVLGGRQPPLRPPEPLEREVQPARLQATCERVVVEP